MSDWGGEFHFFRGIYVRNGIRVNISIFIGPMTYDHHIWQVGASRGVDSNESNQAGTVNVSPSKSRDFEKML